MNYINKPMISVVMISYNHQEFIEDSLMSVIKQQNANYDLEILIVDDGSSDNTQTIITNIQNQYPNLIFPIFKKHVGITAINKNLNEQIKKAKGEYIAFLAGDDQYTENSLVKRFYAFKDNVDLVVGEGRDFDIGEKKYKNTCQEAFIVKMLQKSDIKGVCNYIMTHVPKLFVQGFLIRKSLLNAVGYFDETLIADDWVLNIRIFKYLTDNSRKACYIKDEVFKRNIHSSNTSNNHKDHFLRISQVIQKYVAGKDKKEILKNVYLRYFLVYLKEKNVKKTCVFFIKYLSKDILMKDLAIKLCNKILRKR